MPETTYPNPGEGRGDWPETVAPTDWPETTIRSALRAMESAIGTVPRLSLRPEAGSAPGPAEGDPAPSSTPDRYAILGEIARGGMGAVLHGHDSDLNRDLAIKVLLEAHRNNPDLLRRFIEEAQIGGQLQHPGIVPIYELGHFADKRPFFAMKLVKGRTLADLLKEREFPPDDLPRFLKIFGQVCETMAYAHSRGVIHRDLKPMNIMVGAFGEVQVMDWGLAKVLGRGGEVAAESACREKGVIHTVRSDSAEGRTEHGAFLGTAAFMSPEQARGDLDRLDERADVFALGSILCQVLTGGAAYTGRSGQELIAKAVVADLDEARSRLEACGAEPDLIAIAAACLAPKAEDRPRDASGVARLINDYLAGVQDRLRAAELARVEATTRAEHEQKARILTEARAVQEQRAKRLTVALAGAILLAVTIGGWSWISLRLTHDDRLAQTDRVVGHALSQADALRSEARRDGSDLESWRRALDAAEKAADLLSGRLARPGLQERVDALLADVVAELKQSREQARRAEIIRGLVAKLESARLEEAQEQDGSFDWRAKVQGFRKAFQEAGVDLETWRPEDSARLPVSQADKEAIAASLDDWAFRAPSEKERSLLRASARALDPDPLRSRLRTALAARDLDDLVALATSSTGDRLPASSLCFLANTLAENGRRAEGIALLEKGYQTYPGDFWVNNYLGVLLQESSPPQGRCIRFLTAAVAIRPESPGARTNLGNALNVLPGPGFREEALVHHREAIRLKPDYADAYCNLGTTLGNLRRFGEAAAAFRSAIRLKPEIARYHSALGLALNDLGRHEEAEAADREALRLDPNHAFAHCQLGLVLKSQGRYREALNSLRAGHDLGLKHPNWPFPSARWLAECEPLADLEDRLPALLAREAKPARPDELVTLGAMCYQKKWFAASARFLEEAAGVDPKRAGDPHSHIHYNAACAAALAGTGQGGDMPPPDAASRAVLRAKSLRWLRQDLDAAAEILKGGTPAARAAVGPMLANWKADAGLAGVRDEAALARLPDDERKAWQALWGDVDRLLKTTEAK